MSPSHVEFPELIVLGLLQRISRQRETPSRHHDVVLWVSQGVSYQFHQTMRTHIQGIKAPRPGVPRDGRHEQMRTGHRARRQMGGTDVKVMYRETGEANRSDTCTQGVAVPSRGLLQACGPNENCGCFPHKKPERAPARGSCNRFILG